MTAARSLEHSFTLPDELSATEPPEARGLARDGVRLLVSRSSRHGDEVRHASFHQLPAFLAPGDLLVVNTSATVNAAIEGVRADGSPVTVHFSTELDDGSWLVELRTYGGATRLADARAGEQLGLPAGASLRLLAAAPDPTAADSRLWRAHVAVESAVPVYLGREGRPISYAYVPRRWPLETYQTVFARHPGSAEMPSAARPFTTELVTELVSRGVAITPITLHTGVSSTEAGERPVPERFRVPAAAAGLINATRRAGGRIVAVGTTAARAVETVAGPDGTVRPGKGWTELLLSPARPARVVTGLLTGLHAPDASHLLLLEAVAGRDLVRRAYDAALAQRYLWHEFGDGSLLLP